jgi:myo-inositol-1(or 4)-monophosphatase
MTGWPEATPLRVAEEAATAGGAVLLRHLHDTDLRIAYKDARANLVTIADTESQRAISAVIANAYPDHAIIGEEGTIGDPDAEHAWYVDPLDGTTNYAHRLPFFCVSVAFRTGGPGPAGTTVAGAVYDPLHGDLYSAARNQGAYQNGSGLLVSPTRRLDRSLIVAQAQSVDDREIRAYAALVDRLMRVAGGVRSLGSPALSLCAVAAGRLEAYCEYSMDAWDILAGQLILHEAGGRLTTLRGAPHPAAGRADVVATNGHIHDELIKSLEGLLCTATRASCPSRPRAGGPGPAGSTSWTARSRKGSSARLTGRNCWTTTASWRSAIRRTPAWTSSPMASTGAAAGSRGSPRT